MTTRFLVFVCLGGLALGPIGCGRKFAKAAPPVATAPEPSLADSKPLTTIAPDTNATPPLENVPAPPNPSPTTTPPLPVTPAHTKPAPPARKPAADTTESAAEQTPA